MSSPSQQPDETSESQEPVEEGPATGNLTLEDDPQGTVDPAELAGTASGDDQDVS